MKRKRENQPTKTKSKSKPKPKSSKSKPSLPKRERSFLQMLEFGGSKKNTGEDFLEAWKEEMESIFSQKHKKYKLEIFNEATNCFGLVDKKSKAFKHQWYSWRTYKVFELYNWIRSQEKAVNYNEVLEYAKEKKHHRHVCGNGVPASDKNKGNSENPSCINSCHLVSGNQKDNEADKAFHFFLNFKSSDPPTNKHIQSTMDKLFRTDESFSKIWKEHFGFNYTDVFK